MMGIYDGPRTRASKAPESFSFWHDTMSAKLGCILSPDAPELPSLEKCEVVQPGG